jgi:hypothetical protein
VKVYLTVLNNKTECGPGGWRLKWIMRLGAPRCPMSAPSFTSTPGTISHVVRITGEHELNAPPALKLELWQSRIGWVECASDTGQFYYGPLLSDPAVLARQLLIEACQVLYADPKFEIVDEVTP